MSVAVWYRDRELLLVQWEALHAGRRCFSSARRTDDECKTADTPGSKGTGATLREGDQKLDGKETAVFRSALGSVMYVALDRPVRHQDRGIVHGQDQAIGALSAGVPSGRAGLFKARCTEVLGFVRRRRLGR